MTAKRLDLRLSLLQNLSVEALVDAMNPMSYQKVYMEGVHSLFPEQKLVGQAVTLRFLPVREDLKTETRIGEDSPEYKAIEACGPGVSPLDSAEIFLYFVYFSPLCWQYQSASLSLTEPSFMAEDPFKS